MGSRIAILGAAFIILPSLGAQTPGHSLPAEDPRLYQVFLQFQDDVNSALQAKKGQDPTAGAKAEAGFAHMLRIRHEELPKVNTVAHTFVTDLTKWQKDLKAYVDEARSQNREPDPAILVRFDKTRLQLINSAILQISTSLSSTSWMGLHGYINDQHRLHTSIMEFKASPGAPAR